MKFQLLIGELSDDFNLKYEDSENIKADRVVFYLSYNYTMRFIGYDSIQTCWFIFYHFQIRTIT